MNTLLRGTRLFLLLSTAAVAFSCGGSVRAVTVTATTSDNGYPAHLVSWTDASGNPRSAMMVDQNSTGSGPYTGYLRQYSYVVNGTTRTCTGRYQDGGLETSGDGFVQNHGASDVSTGNGNGFPGTTTISPASGTFSHVTITYSIPTYSFGTNETVPTTVQWFFADGRNDPIFAITQDATGTAGNLAYDSRSPYGDMAYDGDNSGDQTIGGVAWGDTFRFETFDQANATYVNELTPQSAWSDTTPNTIPFAMSWAEPDTCDAEMGHVATVPITIIDQGQDNEDGTAGHDTRNKTSASGLPSATSWAYQLNNYSFGGDPTPYADHYPYPTDDKHITWGGNPGKVGGNNNGAGLQATQYSQHYNDPIGDYLMGTRTNGMLMSYSVFVVLGKHGTTANQYNTSGAVGTVVTQMENVVAASLTATTGTVVTSGPEGVGGSALTTNMTYSPNGYNPVYSTWELTASGNAVSATLTPASGKSLINPVFLIDNYTSTQLPFSISINGQSTSGTDYYVTLDTTNHRLWITANSVASSALSLVVSADVFGGRVVNADLKRSSWFGYYVYSDYPLVFEYNLGYEYAYDAGGGGVYLFDYHSGHFWYTIGSYYPFIYDFSLQTFLYYQTNNANGATRYFYDYATSQVITE